MCYSGNILLYYKTLTKIAVRKRRFTNLNRNFNILLCPDGRPSMYLEGVGPIQKIPVLEDWVLTTEWHLRLSTEESQIPLQSNLTLFPHSDWTTDCLEDSSCPGVLRVMLSVQAVLWTSWNITGEPFILLQLPCLWNKKNKNMCVVVLAMK